MILSYKQIETLMKSYVDVLKILDSDFDPTDSEEVINRGTCNFGHMKDLENKVRRILILTSFDG